MDLNKLFDGSTTLVCALITSIFSIQEQMKQTPDDEGLENEHCQFLTEFFKQAEPFGTIDGKGNVTLLVDDIGDCIPWFCIRNPELFTDETLEEWYAQLLKYDAE